MVQDKNAYALYRATFPDDTFMKKYVGDNSPLRVGDPIHPQRTINTDVYTEIRYHFDSVLRTFPGHQLQLTAPDFDRVYVFQDGQVADWVQSALGQDGLLSDLLPEALPELCADFIAHCRAGAFHQRSWWRWVTQHDSVWVEVIPEALVDGKPPRRSLAGLFAHP